MTNPHDLATLEQSWRRSGLWRGLTMDQAFAQAVRARPEGRLLIHSTDRPVSAPLSEIRAKGLKLARSLYAAGLRAGDVIAVQLPNWLETAMLYHAAAHLNCVVMPVIPIYGAHELTYILNDSRAAALFIPDRWRKADYIERVRDLGRAPHLKVIVVVGEDAPTSLLSWSSLTGMEADIPPTAGDPTAPAFMVYTSGTTAAPKGVVHSGDGLLSEIWQTALHSAGPVRRMSPFPAGHVAGALGMISHAALGETTALFDIWDAKVGAELVARERITHLSGTPYHYMSLMDAQKSTGADFSSLTDTGGGGATVPEVLVERAERQGIHFYRRYGMSEHPTVTRGRSDAPLEERMKTDGPPAPGCEIRIVDEEGADLPIGAEGEVVTRGPELFVGYTDPGLTKEAMLPGRWFRSGDIGRLDEAGALTITDRKKDIIIRGGENISSREVEDLVMRLPGVLEVAAVAMPDAVLGEKVCAFVRAAEGAALSLEGLGAAFREFGVARQKTPERLVLVKDLPRTASGKVKKAELRQMLRRIS
jgi:acyl-CoA synthetase (AMP-forming)/AMP-acid ligase II